MKNLIIGIGMFVFSGTLAYALARMNRHAGTSYACTQTEHTYARNDGVPCKCDLEGQRRDGS